MIEKNITFNILSILNFIAHKLKSYFKQVLDDKLCKAHLYW
jgi:hypothetical protein